MRSLATISSCSSSPGKAGGSEYISRTFPLARRDRSASDVTWRDATSAGGRCSGDLREPREDLGRVAQVVRIVEYRLEVEVARAFVGGQQLAQRDALIPCALGELLDRAV